MAIKVLEYIADENDKARAILFADTKTEVPATGAATDAIGKTKPFTYPSVIVTGDFETAVLGSDNTWGWN